MKVQLLTTQFSSLPVADYYIGDPCDVILGRDWSAIFFSAKREDAKARKGTFPY